MNEIDNRYLNRIQRLMEEKIGLLSTSLSGNNWMACIQKRMEVCDCKTMGEYYTHILNSLTELQEMIQLIVIPETWFFREKKCFDFMTAFINENMQKFRKGRPLRVLSLGCSTGEEPYSVVICLLEAGMPLGTFRVEAVDVSKKSLDFAQRGVYGTNSFRGKNLEFQHRYFNPLKNGFQLKDEVRFTVRFKKGNVVEYPNPNSQNKYDIILCRNLLIYLSPKLQYNLLKRIEKALFPGGILLLGEVENDKIRHLDFSTVAYANITAYCKKELDKESISYKTELFHEIDQILSSGKQSDLSEKKQGDFEKAFNLADQGKLIEAEKLIHDYIEKYGKDAGAFYLQGLIQHARGNVKDAYSLFKKTVYLDPDHTEALLYLSLLSEDEQTNKAAKG